MTRKQPKKTVDELLEVFPDACQRSDNIERVVISSQLDRLIENNDPGSKSLRNMKFTLLTGFPGVHAQKKGTKRVLSDSEVNYWQLINHTDGGFMDTVISHMSRRLGQHTRHGEYDSYASQIPLYPKFAERLKKIEEEKKKRLAAKKVPDKNTKVEQSKAMGTLVDLIDSFKPDSQQQFVMFLAQIVERLDEIKALLRNK